MTSLSKLKFSYECDACDREWFETGICDLFCKECNKFYKTLKPKSNSLDEIFSNENLNCLCKEFLTSNESRTTIDPTKTFAKCTSCNAYVQGFLYSEFYCEVCKYEEILDGLQKISNEKCLCGNYLANDDYDEEFGILSKIRNVNFNANFICARKSCNNIWVNYLTKFNEPDFSITEECEKCQEKVNPFNIQIRKCKKIIYDYNKIFYYDSDTEYSEYTSDSELFEEKSDPINCSHDDCVENSFESDI